MSERFEFIGEPGLGTRRLSRMRLGPAPRGRRCASALQPGGLVHRIPRLLPEQDAADLLGGLGPELDVALDAVEGRVRA